MISKYIGKKQNGLIVVDLTRTNYHDYRLIVKCVKCGKEQEKSRKSFNNATCKCDFCGNGRKKRNANGHYGDSLYIKYWEIRNRLKQKRHYKNLTMCQEWENDFMAFYNWAISNGYKDGLTIDRIDNAKGYMPENCRWVTLKQQANNRRTNKRVFYNGETLTKAEFCEKYNIKKHTLFNRLKYGWTLDEIVNEKVGSRIKRGNNNPNAKAILQYNLKNEFIKEWDCIKHASSKLNINPNCISMNCRGKIKTAGGFIWKYKK